MADPAKPQSPSRRVALFGGSFDPVHRGHLAMATMARQVAGLDEVLFMPAAVSPFKQGTVATAAQRFEMLGIALADAAINVDMIVQNVSHAGGAPATDLSFTVDKPDLLKASKVIEGLKAEIGFKESATDESIGKLSIVGVGMKSHSGVAAKMFDVLAQESVNIGMISTSEIKISVVIELAKGESAMRALHTAFIG
jgi:aspartate kinase